MGYKTKENKEGVYVEVDGPMSIREAKRLAEDLELSILVAQSAGASD